MSRSITNKKQTTVRLDSWLLEELNLLKKGTDSVGTVVSRLLANTIAKDLEMPGNELTVCTNNGLAKVGDQVIAINGSTGKYTITEIHEDVLGHTMVLSPKDKYTMEPIQNKSIFWDYAILRRGDTDGE